MRKTVLFAFFLYWIIFPLAAFAAGRQDVCDLNIENKTGTQVTQIIIEETESKNKPQSFVRSLMNNASTVVQVKRNVLYDIVLVNTNERQYAKRRQVWDDAAANIVFERNDVQNPNFWERARGVIEAGIPVGEAIVESVGEGYRKMKEEDSIRKAAEALGKLTEAGLKAGVDFTIGAGKIIVRVTRYAMERIEQERLQKLNAEERELLDEYVEFTIIP